MSKPKLPYGLLTRRDTDNNVGRLKWIMADSELGLMFRGRVKNLDKPVLDQSGEHDHAHAGNFCSMISMLVMQGETWQNIGAVHMVFGNRTDHCAIVCPALQRTVINYTPKMTWRELAWRLNGYPRHTIEVIHEAAREAGAPFPDDPLK